MSDETKTPESEEQPQAQEELTQTIEVGMRTFSSSSYQSAFLKALMGPVDPETVPLSNARGDEGENAFEQVGTIDPPVDPMRLLVLYEISNALRQNIDAYKTNIDGYGHRFEPVVKVDDPEFAAEVKEHLIDESTVGGVHIGAEPTDEDVQLKIEEVRKQMRKELRDLKTFFLAATEKLSFKQLRKQMRQDLEIFGYGFWEILRDKNNRPAQFEYLPGHTVRLRPREERPVQVSRKINVSPFEILDLKRRRRFRQFVQLTGDSMNEKITFFKEFGDPRFISSASGRIYKSEQDLAEEEGKVPLATEIVHFNIHSARTPYGVPRWAGVILDALGSHEAAVVNLFYFENKSVPPMALLVSGGRVTKETVQRITDFFENEVKGKENFHKIIVLEAEGGSQSPIGLGVEHTGRMRIELVPLNQAINSDALFQKYDERNINKVGATFRLPSIVRGDSRDINRATAISALKFAESQVFAPERVDFDDFMNREILPALGIRYWSYVSNSPKTTDPLDQAKVLEILTRSGAVLPLDARVMAEEILNTELSRADQPWVRIPFSLALAGRVDERLLFDQPVREDEQEQQEISESLIGPDGQLQVPPDLQTGEQDDPVLAEAEQQVHQLGMKREVIVVPSEVWKTWEKGFIANKDETEEE